MSDTTDTPAAIRDRRESAALNTAISATIRGDFRLTGTSIPGLVNVQGHYPWDDTSGPSLATFIYSEGDAVQSMRRDAALLSAEADRLERHLASGKSILTPEEDA